MSHAVVDPFGIVGQVLDSQFRVDRLVGEGGFSAVYRGHHLGLDEPIAIKCLKLPPSLSPELVEQFAKRFRDESRILYRLSQGNLNIVRSMAAGTWQSKTGAVVPFMILEWMEGRSLANEFTIRRTVGHQGRTLAEIVKVFASAADGLGYAHSQGVIHRDLNPGNFFISPSRAPDGGTRMKVLDFGVAKILDDSTLNIARSHTVGQIRIFAPAYGAPEQFDDSIGKISAATDVYAFALILLEALRDRSVNDGQHLGEFAHKAIDPNVRPTPRRLGLDVSDEVEQIFARATKLDPRDRWQTVGELWQALAMASSSASQQKHAQAAKETPPLAMPKADIRSTKAGLAPPQQPKPQGPVRMEKTLPIGAVLPNVAVPKPNEGVNEEEDIPTRVGARLVDPPTPMAPLPEPEEEVTRVRPPELEMFARVEAAVVRAPNATAPTRVAPHGVDPGAPPGPAGPAVPEPPPSGGTLMIAPNAIGQDGLPQPPPQGPTTPLHQPEPRRPSGQLAMTMPLAGPHPLGLPTQQGQGGPLPAAGAPPQQHPQHAQHVQQTPPSHPQQHPQHPQHQYAQPHHQQQQHAPHQQQQQQQQVQMHAMQQPMHSGPATGWNPYPQQGSPAASLPPAGVPKKGNTLLFVGIGLGALALVGVVLIVVALGKKGDGKEALASTSASASFAIASASAPPPPSPPSTPDPAPTPAAVEADAGDNGSAANTAPSAAPDTAASATATATAPTATTTAPPTPPPTPTTPSPGPTWTPPTPTPAPLAVKDAGPPPDPDAWNESVARSRLSQANGILAFCKKSDGPTGPGSAVVTFAPDGTVAAVIVNPPYAGTPVGDCVAGHFKRTKTNPWKGGQQSLKHSFDVPK